MFSWESDYCALNYSVVIYFLTPLVQAFWLPSIRSLPASTASSNDQTLLALLTSCQSAPGRLLREPDAHRLVHAELYLPA